jgi:uncharacterized protein (DUF1501 family)
MLSLRDTGPRLCDGLSRREMLRVGGLSALGLSWPLLLRAAGRSTHSTGGRAKSCILLFLMGGPPQHSTWDPKPDAPAEVRGEFGPIRTAIPGIQVCELLPQAARHADKLCLLRAVSTGDNAHSSSGYYMMTGVPHQPTNQENANPGPPNDWPHLGAVVRRLRGDRTLPAAVRLPCHIFNTDGSVWPGQDAGWLGRTADPWLFRGEPASPDFRIPEFTMPVGISSARFGQRQALLRRLDDTFAEADRAGLVGQYDRLTQQAFDLLRADASRAAFDLEREPAAVRDRYGRTQFGQSVLLARRLVEAGVAVTQVNWFRGPDEPADAPCWDSHANESQRLKLVLAPAFDQAFGALLEDLSARGMLDETLVVCLAEFGRTPRFNSRAGRDHWGAVFSCALAGGGIQGGLVYGASDELGAQPATGRVEPQDLTATILHCLGYAPDVEIRDILGRPLPASRGEAIRAIL